MIRYPISCTVIIFFEILFYRPGGFIVDYELFTDTDATATSEVLSVAQDLVSGKENVTYDGQEAPVSFAAFTDTSGNNGMHLLVNELTTS
jgi:hypothetical protein